MREQKRIFYSPSPLVSVESKLEPGRLLFSGTKVRQEMVPIFDFVEAIVALSLKADRLIAYLMMGKPAILRAPLSFESRSAPGSDR